VGYRHNFVGYRNYFVKQIHTPHNVVLTQLISVTHRKWEYNFVVQKWFWKWILSLTKWILSLTKWILSRKMGLYSRHPVRIPLNRGEFTYITRHEYIRTQIPVTIGNPFILSKVNVFFILNVHLQYNTIYHININYYIFAFLHYALHCISACV
jgi:hypothetical protein